MAAQLRFAKLYLNKDILNKDKEDQIGDVQP